jgi:DNA-binding phage protein
MPKEVAAHLGAWFVESRRNTPVVARALGDTARAKDMVQAANDAACHRERLSRAGGVDGGSNVATILNRCQYARCKAARCFCTGGTSPLRQPKYL